MKLSIFFRTACLLGVIGVVLLSSCGQETVSSHSVNDQSFVMEGPLFQGPNTAQASFSPAMNAEGKLTSATLNSAVLKAPEGQNFDAFSDVVLQLVTSSSDMIQVGVLNPVPKGQSSLTLQVSNEADLSELLSSEECVWVIDANIPVDMMDTTITFSGDFTFDVIHTK
ncbi:MAG: hypothetical protein RIC19_20675 [Phaeodactylibacter sp.]|uniref:hypothetical protein n=1 Tax=Phaeodactylibacter sp. TaxID=1940289 RepID=UPI0032EBE7AD